MRLPLELAETPDEPTYVYARRSRRAGGLCLGVDLAPNGGCNWACVYCDTVRARAEGPEIDQERLARQLSAGLDRVAQPDFAGGEAPVAVLVSGSGEPTNVYDFAPSMETLATVLRDRGLVGQLKPILLTNGERISERRSRAALGTVAELQGSVWYKLDTATREGLQSLNGTELILRQMRNHLRVAAETLPTWLQTCVFERDGAPSLDEDGREAYVTLVRSQLAARVPIQGVQLYTPHRERAGITAPARDWVEAFAARVGELLPVELTF